MRRPGKPKTAKADAKRPSARKSSKDPAGKVSDPEKRLAEALAQHAATAEILRAISQSHTDPQPAFDAIADSAMRLFRAWTATVFRLDGDFLYPLAVRGGAAGSGDAAIYRRPLPVSRDTVNGRCIVDRSVVHVPDVQTDPDTPARARENATARGFRAALGVPLLRNAQPVGTIAVSRAEAGPFSEDEIALLQTFADQAVIALENARLLNELQDKNAALTLAHAQVSEALEQQTATEEILRTLSTSPTDHQPVFDTIVRNARRVCGAADALLGTIQDGEFVIRAHEGPIHAPIGSRRPMQGTVAGRAVSDMRVVQVEDLAEGTEFDAGRNFARAAGFRTTVGIPLLRKGVALGVIMIRRTEVRLFTPKEIELLKTFADQAVIAIENVRLFTESQEKNRALTHAHAQVSEALEQQTATSDILRVISSSPTDVQPVFDAIASRGARLCDADFCIVFRFDGTMITLAAHDGRSPGTLDVIRAAYPAPPGRRSISARTIFERRVVSIADAQDPIAHPPGFEGQADRARAVGYRSIMAVPMLRDDAAIGAINVARLEVRPFSDREIALLQTFADQAVIAIENVRLFKELEAKNASLTEALDQQTATGEILRIMSSSPTNVQPVFDSIVRSAKRLLNGHSANMLRVIGDELQIAALTAVSEAADAETRATFPVGLTTAGVATHVIRTRCSHIVADIETDPLVTPRLRITAPLRGFRSMVVVPMVHQEQVIGVIVVTRRSPGAFSEDEVALLETFADQAVIAIENVRLFTELQARNAALTEALDRQTATAEILRVISQSQTEVQPVFDAIVDNAIRLFRGWAVAVLRLEGELLHLVAARGGLPGTEEYLRRQSPWPIQGLLPASRCVAQRSLIHIPDSELDPTLDETLRGLARTRGWRSVLAAPLLRDGHPIGAITVTRAEAGPFSAAEIELLQTFADQAVIAVENARLLGELQARTTELTRSVDQLTALGEVGRAVSSTLNLEIVLSTIVSRAVQLSGLDGGVVFEYDDRTEEFVQRAATESGGTLAEVRRATRIRKGEGVVGRTAIILEPVQVPDITVPGTYESRLRENLVESGVRAILAVPMVREGHLIGCLGVTRNQPGDFPAETIELLRTFATQSALAIQNARLFHEIEDKSRQLEAASQHKSEFLANMSHELRTPLNAIIGFSEVLGERMFGGLNEKQDEYLKDIHASGQHLLSLINDILDLSKIEAGRMELELGDVDLPATLHNALTLVRERAGRHGIALNLSVDERLEQIRADERKVRQVVLNLLSNAIKFTPEGGRIDVRAMPVDGMVEVSVTDTGVGIAPEDQEAIFEEFRQVGTAAKKVEGTGLGLALSRKFVELHGGRIWVKSQMGQGSTFTFTLPIRLQG